MYQSINTNSVFARKINQEYKSKIYEEVGLLMRAFGDITESGQQIKESVILVEKILIQQLKDILDVVMNNAYKRTGAFVPSQLDFELLMHRNKAKLIRFRKYMKNIQKIQCKSEQIASGGNFNTKFLNRMSEDSDDEGEVYDAEKIRRLYRADRISQVLSVEKYEEFQKARSWSSNMRNKMSFINKLVEILQVPKEIQEDSNCLEIIQFLTQETIATIVDYAILTRLNSDNLTRPDQSIVPSNLSNNMLQICPEVTQGRGHDGIQAIKVQEIHEAMRRVQLMHNQRKLGTCRITDPKIAFLAL